MHIIMQEKLGVKLKISRINLFVSAKFYLNILFGFFMWARNCSKKRLLEKDDVLWAWRERMLDLYDGFARNSNGFEIK